MDFSAIFVRKLEWSREDPADDRFRAGIAQSLQQQFDSRFGDFTAVDLAARNVVAGEVDRGVFIPHAAGRGHVIDPPPLKPDKFGEESLRNDVVAQHHAVGAVCRIQSENLPRRVPPVLESVTLQIELRKRNAAFGSWILWR